MAIDFIDRKADELTEEMTAPINIFKIASKLDIEVSAIDLQDDLAGVSHGGNRLYCWILKLGNYIQC